MTFSVTLFGPSNFWWGSWKRKSVRRVWFYRPDEHSTGGIGFCIPGLHVVFTWGKDKKGTRNGR